MARAYVLFLIILVLLATLVVSLIPTTMASPGAVLPGTAGRYHQSGSAVRLTTVAVADSAQIIPHTVTIQAIDPTSGENDQATRVTITGSGLSVSPPPTARLTMLGSPSINLIDITPLSSTQFEAIVPAGLTPGIYDLVVTSGGSTTILPSAFWVLIPITATPTATATRTATATPTATAIPTATATRTATAITTATATRTATAVPSPTATTSLSLQSINPREGVNNQATRVTITGSGLSVNPPPTARLVGLSRIVALTEITAQSSTQFMATVPAGLPPGIYDLVVSSGGRISILASAFWVLSAEGPIVSRIEPTSAFNDAPTELIVYGTNFASGAVVRLGNTELTTNRVNSQKLLAIVPSELTPGLYDVTVINPGDLQTQLNDAFTVLDATSSTFDDLLSSSDLLWINPQSPRAGTPFNLGLFVQRNGGSTALENVPVTFRQDAITGTLLATSTVPFLDPVDSIDTTIPVTVTLNNPGQVTIFALIDEAASLNDSDRSNNVYSRTITIGQPATDQIPPTVNGISINGGDTETVTSRELTVGVRASDPAPASGVRHAHIIEYVYLEGIQRWVPVNQSGWLTFNQDPEAYAWTLLPQPGMRYLQVRARDAAGNISIGQARRLLNYEVPSDTITRGQTRIYRYELAAGQSLQVDLDVVSGDADLYVWSSGAEQSAAVSNLPGTADEQVRVDPVVPGIYQVEVYGYLSSEYRLNVTIGAATGNWPSRARGGISQAKTPRTVPVVAVSALPDVLAGNVPDEVVPLAPEHLVYLPMVRR